ncbi:S1/P1 nuclease-domain-containing protein [Russula earlei]|uniref:S1/P1 nuclease-domain-containing protein n=1 Tax=Russula earlei TaxID=71964 RepID=A0ACC0TY08_9AGAM|nr:S1/P1 nuclease-domain-containing protein [Russula earlei]
MKKAILSVVIAALFFTLPISSFAWGKKGHQMVAEIAFHFLDENTKQAVQHYLGRMSIEDAATWMDDMRSNHYYDYMKTWHYIDITKGQAYQPSAEKNIVTVLHSAIAELSHMENMKDADIKTDLLLIFHLTGDLSQPLHTGYPEDKGGNSIDVRGPGFSRNLHSVWDSEIIEDEKISMDDCLKLYDSYTPAEIAAIKKINVLKWMEQSRSLLDTVYDFKDDRLTQEYINANKKIIEQQLLFGGLRLASILAAEFKSAPHFTNTSTTTAPTPASNANQEVVTIPVEDASKHEGETVKICTKIYGSKYLETAKGKPTFLNAGAKYPNSPLTLVIWDDNRSHFKNAPDTYYDGKSICVTGKIEMFKGKPEMVLTDESQVVVQ